MKESYELDILLEDQDIDFNLWCNKKCEEQPTFKYWYMVIKIILIYLILIKSFREGDFESYKCSLSAIMPYFFANDNTHYSRWGTVHLHDMLDLKENDPSIYDEFVKGNFVLHESSRIFSGIALDQAHEHNNRFVKSDGGVIGITEHETALLRWMTAGPEVCHLVKSYKEAADGTKNKTNHHEDTLSEQRKFFQSVQDMSETISEYGNPFLEDSAELVSLDTNLVTDKEVLDAFETTGKDQFNAFRQKVNTNEFYSSIKKNNFELFQSSFTQTTKSKPNKQLKQDCVLFSNLFIMCQSRQLNLDDFFKYENQASPPALSSDGELYKGTKSDIVTVIKDECQIPSEDIKPDTDLLIIDGAMYVHTNPPKTDTHTFSEYTANFQSKISANCEKHHRVDIVFDQYIPNSLKASTRHLRGDGRKCKVTSNGKIPKNWKGFLRNSLNKADLFELLAKSVNGVERGIAYASVAHGSVCNKIVRAPIECTHEEADTRLFVHLKHAILTDCISSVSIHANDSDIVILATAFYHELNNIGLKELWVSYGRGRTTVWLPIHKYAKKLGAPKSKALLFFHAFSGCDTVSAFRSKGKKSFF